VSAPLGIAVSCWTPFRCVFALSPRQCGAYAAGRESRMSGAPLPAEPERAYRAMPRA
jgi:hypothetical protein